MQSLSSMPLSDDDKWHSIGADEASDPSGKCASLHDWCCLATTATAWTLFALNIYMLHQWRSSRQYLGFTFAVTMVVSANQLLGLLLLRQRRRLQREVEERKRKLNSREPSATQQRGVGRKKKGAQAAATNHDGASHTVAVLSPPTSTAPPAQSCGQKLRVKWCKLIAAVHSPRAAATHSFISLVCFALLVVSLVANVLDGTQLPTRDANVAQRVLPMWLITTMLTLNGLVAGFQGLQVAMDVLQHWTPAYRFARSALSCVAVLQVACGMLLLVLNLRVSTWGGYSIPCVPLYLLQAHEWLGLIATVAALHSLNLVALFRGTDRVRLSNTLFFHTAFSIAGIITALSFEVLFLVRYHQCDIGFWVDASVARAAKNGASDAWQEHIASLAGVLDDLRTVNISLVSAQIALYLLSIWLSHRLPAPTPSRLAFEELHLASIDASKRRHLCASLHRANEVMGPRGNFLTAEATLQLMQAYQSNTLNKVRGVALRIYRPAPGSKPNSNTNNSTHPSIASSGVAPLSRPMTGPVCPPTSVAHASSEANGDGQSPAELPLGSATPIPVEGTSAAEIDLYTDVDVTENGVPLSKNAAKKMQKKAAAKAARAAVAAATSVTRAAAGSAASVSTHNAAPQAPLKPAIGDQSVPTADGNTSVEAPTAAAAAAATSSSSLSSSAPRVPGLVAVPSPAVSSSSSRPVASVGVASSSSSSKSVALDHDLFLAFITIIEEYDTSAQVGGWPGRMLSYLFGAASPLPWRWAKPTLMRMGLVGFQFPFKSGLWPLLSDNDARSRSHVPAAASSSSSSSHLHRSAAWQQVLKALIEWNESRPASRRCDILLLPAQENEFVGGASLLIGGGFFPIAMPPTHILDLRPYAGFSLAQFLQGAAKKGSRKDLTQIFAAKGGHARFQHRLSPTQAEAMARNSGATAAIRHARAEPSMLLKPTPEFIHGLSDAVTEQHCHALLLHFAGSVDATTVAIAGEERKESRYTSVPLAADANRSALQSNGLDGLPTLDRTFSSAALDALALPNSPFGSVDDIIASCVVFEFPGSLMTSDIHGQLHDKSRPLKAYFTMMQLVVARALAAGIPLIDFGPTTAGPKLDLGCRSVGLRGGAYSRNLLLAAIMRTAAKLVVDVHLTPNATKEH